MSRVDLAEVSGLSIELDVAGLRLCFGDGVVGPEPERRSIDAVRPMLEDPLADGPDPLYSIQMDIHREQDAGALREQGLLYGSMVYNSGVLGREWLRSQGHVHTERPGTGLRYSELFEFWTGEGFLYLQREQAPDVTRALLVPVGPGSRVILPFGWVHLVIATGGEPLSFGAWCARDNGFEYDELRRLQGPAHYVHADGGVVPNPRYRTVPELERVDPADLPTLGVPLDRPIYTTWTEHPDLFEFMSRPEVVGDAWRDI